MSGQFERVLSADGPFVSENATELPTNQLLRCRFLFYMSMLKGYANHLQEVENKDKPAVQELVNELTNKLVEKYSFGSKFVNEINRHILGRFNPPAMSVRSMIQRDSGLSDAEFSGMIADLKQEKLTDLFSNRFKMILR